MNPIQLKRVFNLIQETGDRLIVADNNSDDIFVVMSLPEYKDLHCQSTVDKTDFGNSSLVSCHECEDYDNNNKDVVDLTEQELLEKINNDISVWQLSQEKNNEILIEEEMESSSLSELSDIENDQDIKSADENKEEIQNNEINKTDEEPTIIEIKEAVAPVRTLPHTMSSLGDVLKDDNYRRRDFGAKMRQNITDEEDLSDVKSEDENRFYLESV